MLNRWIAGTCIGLALIGGGLSASLSWAQTQTQQAVSSYVNVTLPAIAHMKPWIDKSAADRIKAFATMGITNTTCDAPTSAAIQAKEHIAEGAGDLCQAMIAWMQDEDLFTCSRVSFSGNDFAHTEPVDPTIAKLHTSEGVLSTRLQLEKAAGCATKTITYWGPKALALSAQLAASISNSGELQAPSSGAAVPTREAFENTIFLCHIAYNGDEKSKSKVVDAADDACYAMSYLLAHNVADACSALERSMTKVFSMGDSDPLAREAKGLSERLTQRFSSLDCAATIAASKAAEDAKAAQQAAATPPPAPPAPVNNPYAKRNVIVGSINGEIQSVNNSYEVAQRWFDRGEDAEACGYYQKALSSLRDLRSLYSDLYRETGDSDDSAKSREMQDEESNLFEAYGDMCVDAGRRLY